MSLPPVAASVTAEAVAALPARLQARLDGATRRAHDWPATSSGALVTVRPDEKTTVTLTLPVVAPGDAVCSCLLAPRCLHRAAVLSAAPVLTDQPLPAAAPSSVTPPPTGTPDKPPPTTATGLPRPSPDPTASTPTEPPAGAVPVRTDAPVVAGPGVPPSSSRAGAARRSRVDDAQAGAARDLWSAAAAVLSTGLPGAGAVCQADVLRAVHQARAHGLHAAAGTAVRVVEHLRAARREDPAFHLADLTGELRDLLLSCHRVAGGDPAALGVARRDYEPVGDLRLYGLCCEPIRVGGHAGTVTYLADARGRVWVVSDVKPAGQVAQASVELGEVRLSHHELARAGLLAVNAHASAAGRLSHGRARRAVASPGAGWFDDPIGALWLPGLADQVDRWLTAAALPAHERPAAHDLAFLDGCVLGADRRGVLLAVEPHDLTVAVTAPQEDPSMPYVSNLRLLAAHALGHRVRIVGRFTGTRRVAGLALAASWLPPRHGGHIDLGASPLIRADLPAAPAAPRASADDPPVPPPLHLLRHHLERVVAAGRAALLPGVTDDARRLTAAHLTTAAATLTELGAAGVRRTRDTFGRLDPHDAETLARAWLTAAIYEQSAAREATRAGWAGVRTGGVLDESRPSRASGSHGVARA